MRKLESLIAINNVRCIQFRPRVSSDVYYITIRNGEGCSSYVGQNTEFTMERTVTLNYPGCFDDGRTMHEFIHTLGFYHEQSRPDRDAYVEIIWKNIQTNTQSNFQKYDNTAVNTLNTPYDYASIMHYEETAFSINSSPTIKLLQANVKTGQRYKLSPIDIQEIRQFYNCPATGSLLTTAMPTTTTDQVFGDEEMHATVRQNCMDYIVKNADFFRSYITEDFDHYVTRKRRQHCHGNHIEMIALSELYNRPIEVYEYSIEPINIVHGMYKTDNEPIRLSYHCGVHYNSIIDPWRPTAGHGLGFPDLEPGRAQESLIRTAVRQSEESHIERAMLDDKIAATDWEATQEELIQQVARESYLQWLCDANQQHKDNKTMPSSSSSPTSATTYERTANSNHGSSPRNLLPLRLDERKDCEFALPFNYECDPSSNPDLDDDDDSLMRQVLAISQIEYVETLKKQQKPPKSDDPDEPSSSSDTHLL
ncbi:unnamed protein product [Rotaria sordida]|uniref:Metalloendopeptidase n=2 Tax=Rotaria sordida TaxID=392033 RepID=A0A819MLH4_9BILA|nr:unnamed protein product [Rotaria sordida]